MSWYKGSQSSWDGEKPFTAWHDKWEERKEDKEYYYKSNPKPDHHSKSWHDDDKPYHSKSWQEDQYWDDDWKASKFPRNSTYQDNPNTRSDSEDAWFRGWTEQGTSSSSNSSYPNQNHSNPNTRKTKPEKKEPSTLPLPAEPYLMHGKLFDGPSELLASQLPCFFQLRLGKCGKADCKFLHCDSLLQPNFQVNRDKWIDLLNRRKQQATRQEAARGEEPNSNSNSNFNSRPKSRPSPPEPAKHEPPASSDSTPPKRNRPDNPPKGPPIGSGQTSYYHTQEQSSTGKPKVQLASRSESGSGRVWRGPPSDEHKKKEAAEAHALAAERDKDRDTWLPGGKLRRIVYREEGFAQPNKSTNQIRGRTRQTEDRSLSPPSSADEQVQSKFDADIRDDIPTEEDDLKKYDVQYPNPTKEQLEEMMDELQSVLQGFRTHLYGRDTNLDYQIDTDQFPTALVTYWTSVMIMNGWTKKDIHQIKFLRDDEDFIWIWIKFRPYEEDGAFTKLKSTMDCKYRFCHGTTPAGNFGISHNTLNDSSQGILPQIGSLSYKSYIAQKGFFALAFEVSDDRDNNWGELKSVINSFKHHGKNQIGVGWTGLITGPKCGKKHGAWAAQKILSTSHHDIVTIGSKVFCLRCTRATVDGALIKIATQPPTGYNPTKPFQIH